MTIRIVLADDHEIVRDGVRLLIERETDMKLVGEANDGWEAIRLAAELQPDVLIMDITMNGLNGIEATCELHRSHPKIRVLALSMHSDKRFVKKMLEAGACGFMLKNSAGKELISAIRTIHNRSTFLSQPIIDLMVADYGGNGAPVENAIRPPAHGAGAGDPSAVGGRQQYQRDRGPAQSQCENHRNLPGPNHGKAGNPQPGGTREARHQGRFDHYRPVSVDPGEPETGRKRTWELPPPG